jgi:hypothetical protein
MLFLLATLAAAEPALPEPTAARSEVGRAQLAPDPRRNVRESSHVLAQGEILLGSDGFAVGVLPALQLGTKPLLDAVGWVNGSAKVEAIRGDHLGLSVQGAGGGASWGEMSGRSVDLGSTLSLTPSPVLSLHAGPHFGVLSMEGVPTDPPTALAEWLPMAGLQAAAQASADTGLVPRVYARHTDVRAAVELRLNRRDSVVLSGAASVWGQNGTDLLTDASGQEALDPRMAKAVDWARSLGQTGNRRVALSYRVAFGNADVRVGAGLSDVAGAWIPDAIGADLRAFGEARQEDRRLLAEARDGEAVHGPQLASAPTGSGDTAMP